MNEALLRLLRFQIGIGVPGGYRPAARPLDPRAKLSRLSTQVGHPRLRLLSLRKRGFPIHPDWHR